MTKRAQKIQSAISEEPQALSAGKLLSLLNALQEVYGAHEIQLKLKELREAHGLEKLKKRGLHTRTTLPKNPITYAYTQDLHSMLIPVQAPVFERFGLPSPPEGLEILILSLKAHAGNAQVNRTGNYCRMLLGQLDFYSYSGLELPVETLLILLHNLRVVYAMPDLQRKLKELSEKYGMDKECQTSRCSYHATNLAYARDQRDLLASFQEPVFHQLCLPGPPLGIDLMQASVIHWRKTPAGHMVNSIGGQCRWLLGQLDFNPGAAGMFQDSAFEQGVDIRMAGSKGYGYGTFAVRSFAAGERILLEEPLAVLSGNDILSTPSAPLELWRSGQLQKILNSRLTSGPKKSPKRAMYANFARAALQKHCLSEQELDDVIKALCIFGFNAFALRGDHSQALFQSICVCNHSCEPNATLVTSNAGPSELICIKEIKVDDEITLSYLSVRELFLDYTDRQQHLFRNWEFRCCCPRCRKEQEKEPEALSFDDTLNCEAQLELEGEAQLELDLELDLCYAW